MLQRGSFSIQTLILMSVSQRRMTRTRIMHELVLTYSRTVKYTDNMIREGFLDFNPADRTLGITARGYAVLQLSQELAGYMSPICHLIDKYRAPDHEDEKSVSLV